MLFDWLIVSLFGLMWWWDVQEENCGHQCSMMVGEDVCRVMLLLLLCYYSVDSHNESCSSWIAVLIVYYTFLLSFIMMNCVCWCLILFLHVVIADNDNGLTVPCLLRKTLTKLGCGLLGAVIGGVAGYLVGLYFLNPLFPAQVPRDQRLWQLSW